jgi:hypothetical protein
MISPARSLRNVVVLLGLLSVLRCVVAKKTWVGVGSVVASDASEGGSDFGRAVAMSDTTMVVGDPYDGGGGRAYVYSLRMGLHSRKTQYLTSKKQRIVLVGLLPLTATQS